MAINAAKINDLATVLKLTMRRPNHAEMTQQKR